MKRHFFLITLAALMLSGSSCARGTQAADRSDTFTTRSGKTIRIRAIKHASLEINYDGRIIEVDPVADAVQPHTDYSKMERADLILVTHEHHDHFDPAAIDVLAKDGTRLILNQRCADMIKKGTAMKNGDSLRLADDMAIRATAAYNTTPGNLKYHPKGRDNGFILEMDGFRIYIAGDTEVIPEMRNMGPIDVAFLPCNQPFTMTPEQLHEAAAMIRPKVLYPYHFSQTSKEAMRGACEGLGIDVRIRNFE
ncbi:MAG: MBL fold metallo-hydrolase [Prevotella sp.]|nr:MBL fold metallo-hydrolase [Prevotella sp.]